MAAKQQDETASGTSERADDPWHDGEGVSPEDLEELEELERAAAEAYEELGRAAGKIGDRAADAYASSRTFVRENPGGTMLTSFVIGVVLGVFFSSE